MRKYNKVFQTLPVLKTEDQLGFGDDLIEAFYKLTPAERKVVTSILDRLKPGLTDYEYDDFDSLPAVLKLLS